MNAVLASFGVTDLPAQTKDIAYPAEVPGRVAHIDADFLAYQVSAETRDELDGIKPRKSLEDMQYNARAAAEHLMRMTGATSYRCHITPSGSDKGGRAEQAVQQEYQATRQDRTRPANLDLIRAFIGRELSGVVHLDQEADDGMTQAQYAAILAGDTRRSVIVSRDKDLRMVPGLHFDFDTDTVHEVQDVFGEIWLDDSKTSKTLKGWGTKFFWAQCLMGDTADNIKGLPAVPGSVHCRLQPTQAYEKALARLHDIMRGQSGVETTAAVTAQNARLAAMHAKTKPCGPAMAFALLDPVQDDAGAFRLVRDLFTRLHTEHQYEYTHWRTGAAVTPTQALLGDMRLLWMRRNKNPDDVLYWLRRRT